MDQQQQHLEQTYGLPHPDSLQPKLPPNNPEPQNHAWIQDDRQWKSYPTTADRINQPPT